MTEKTSVITLDEADFLGSGASRDVYCKEIDGETRAIKCITLRNDKEMQAAREELELLEKLRSEHVVPVYHFHLDQKPRRAMIVMEYMEGGSLEHLIEDNPLPERHVIFYLRQILEGVVFMHENHVVHRDLKPANFLLDKNGYIKICDLGVAKFIHTMRSDKGMQTNCGTPQYMSPEAFKGQYGNKTDIWSVGATLAHMITGQEPYPQLQGFWGIMWNVANGFVQYDLQGKATPQMDSFVGWLMQFEIRNRPHAPEALERLERFQTENNTEDPCVAFEDSGAVARPTNSESRLSKQLIKQPPAKGHREEDDQRPLSKRAKEGHTEAVQARPVARYSEVEKENERMQRGPETDDRMETRASEEAVAKGILTTGGYPSLDSIELYSLNTNTSLILPTPMREDRWGHVSGVLRDGRVMLAGGCNRGASALSSTELIDPDSFQPTPGPSMNTARRYASSAVLNGVFYVGGGLDEKGNPLSSCEQCRDGEWMRISDMQEARLYHAMVAVDKYIYAIGVRGKNNDVLDSVERYCPETDTWQIVRHSNYKRYRLAAAECNGCIYVCGGWDENYKPLRICERYSPIANRWQRMADMNLARVGLCLVSVGGKLYAVGGRGDGRSPTSVECYDVGKDKWEMVGELKEWRWGHSAVVVPYS